MNSFGIKAFTLMRQINAFHVNLRCYVDQAVSGECSLSSGAWKNVVLNCCNSELWTLGKENSFDSGTRQQL